MLSVEVQNPWLVRPLEYSVRDNYPLVRQAALLRRGVRSVRSVRDTRSIQLIFRMLCSPVNRCSQAVAPLDMKLRNFLLHTPRAARAVIQRVAETSDNSGNLERRGSGRNGKLFEPVSVPDSKHRTAHVEWTAQRGSGGQAGNVLRLSGRCGPQMPVLKPAADFL